MNSLLVFITIVLILIANTLYIKSIFQGKTKPHIYSWIIWWITNSIACLIQFSHSASWWALALGFGGIMSIFVVILSIWYGEKNITRFDTLCFVITLCIIPLWLVAQQDLLAMSLAILVDALSFWPTIRKSFHKPFEESLFPYYASGISFFLSLMLISNVSLINILYPIIIGSMNFCFIGYIYIRRVR